MIHLTVQLPVLSQGSSDKGGGGGNVGSNIARDFQNLSADGYSLAEAIRQIQIQTPKNIDEAETRSVIVSQGWRQLRWKALWGSSSEAPRLPRATCRQLYSAVYAIVK